MISAFSPIGFELVLQAVSWKDSMSVLFEVVERHLSVLADLDEVAVGIAHVATPFPTVIVERLGEEERSFRAPLFVTGPDVGDAQIEEAVHPVEIQRGVEENIGLVRRRATTRIENDPGIGELDIAGIFRLDYFPAKNADVEVLRFFLIFHGEEMRDEKAFIGNRRVGQIHAVASCEQLIRFPARCGVLTFFCVSSASPTIDESFWFSACLPTMLFTSEF